DMILNNKIDDNFVNNHCNDFETLKKQLLKLPKTKLLKRTGLQKEDFLKFMEMFYENENIISCWTMGLNQSSQGVDKNIALMNIHLLSGKICKVGNGPFSLTGQPNAMGGREVGGLSTMLAVHLDYNEENIQKVNQFWETKKVPKSNGLTAFEIFEEALKDNIEVLIVCHTDPVYHLPNRRKVEKAISKIGMVIEINAYEDSETSNFAHIKLPASPWGEKEGTQTNMDRTITKQERLTRRSIDCRDDWEIFQLIAQNLGFGDKFNYACPEDIFKEYQQMCRLSKDGHLDIYKTSYSELKEKPFVWGEGLFDNKQFFTENKKANLFFVTNKNLSEKTNKIYPFLLLTGRTRDQWHSGTKTSFVDSLSKYKKSNFVEINPKDAEVLEIKDGEKVIIESSRGELISYAKIADTIPSKTIFIPITNREINYLTDDLLDNSSKEPDYNHSAVKIKKACLTSYQILVN
ncbi:MAG: molybdopterin-dependent oxidoreductase, partial [Arcobacter sp.]|nr:molybdopterin-dependent oxidoreductase [Arcobacter sp.]